jgi:hypothetical protein
VAAVKTSTLATGSHLLFMTLDDGGPPAVLGLDASDQGESRGPSDRWAILVGDQFQQAPPRATALTAPAKPSPPRPRALRIPPPATRADATMAIKATLTSVTDAKVHSRRLKVCVYILLFLFNTEYLQKMSVR